MGAVTGFARPLRLAIVGGGFTGVALAIYALASGKQPLSVDVIEPSEKLGRGAAYGTTDPDHRINVPTDRMSLFSSEPTYFTRWLFENEWLPDPESTYPLGRFYVPRKAFAAYLEATLAQTTRSTTSASLRHRQTRVIGLIREGEGFCLDLADGASLRVRPGRDLHRPRGQRSVPCPRGGETPSPIYPQSVDVGLTGESA